MQPSHWPPRPKPVPTGLIIVVTALATVLFMIGLAIVGYFVLVVVAMNNYGSNK